MCLHMINKYFATELPSQPCSYSDLGSTEAAGHEKKPVLSLITVMDPQLELALVNTHWLSI